MTKNINQVLVIFNAKELSVNRNDLQAATLVGQNRENPVLDPLAVQQLNNELYIIHGTGLFIMKIIFI